MERFTYVNDSGLSYYDIARDLDKKMEEGEAPPDIIFVDTIRAGFTTSDENDNSEATEQMKRIRKDVDKWKNCVVLVHHTSKAGMVGTRKGSGAFARAAMCDIQWTFEQPDEENHPEIVLVEIPKNRMIDDRFKMFLRKQEYQFIPCDPPPGFKEEGYMASTIRYESQRRLETLLSPLMPKNLWTLQRELETLVGHKVPESTTRTHLGRLIALGVAQKTSRGMYMLRNGKLPSYMLEHMEEESEIPST
jgi:hypothetical protein